MNGCRLGAFALLAAVLTVAGCSGEEGGEPRGGAAPAAPTAERAVPVTVGEVTVRRVEDVLEQVGTLQANREVTVRSETAGTVREVSFEEGRPVAEGAVLVRLDAEKTRAEIRRLDARIRQLRVRLANKRRELARSRPLVEAEIQKLDERIRQLRTRLASRERELERNRPLVEEELVSRQSFDRLETEVEEIRGSIAETQVEIDRQKDLVLGQAADRLGSEIGEVEAEIAQAEAALAAERIRLADATIRAPFGAVAGVREVNVGDYLAVGAPVVTLVDLDPLEISFRVPEKHLARVAPGQAVRLRVDAFPGLDFEGRISFVAPRVDSETRTFQVKAQVANADRRLSPGMFVEVTLVTDVREAALTVPWDSVVQTEAGTYLYAVEGDRARKVPVRLGETTSRWAEVAGEGLAPGVSVVEQGKFALRDGAAVSIRRPDDTSPRAANP